MKLILLDIDGCLINMNARWAALQAQRVTWEQYNSWEEMSKDVVIPAGKVLYTALMAIPNHQCVFVTARQEQQRENTAAQLNLHLGYRGRLLMRPDGEDYLPDTKLRILKRHGIGAHDVAFAVDDDTHMVASYLAAGIVAYTAPGV